MIYKIAIIKDKMQWKSYVSVILGDLEVPIDSLNCLSLTKKRLVSKTKNKIDNHSSALVEQPLYYRK